MGAKRAKNPSLGKQRPSTGWAGSMARLKAREPLTASVDLEDAAASDALVEATMERGRVERAAYKRAHAEHPDAEDAVIDAAAQADPELLAAIEAQEAAQEAADEARVSIKFRGIPVDHWEALMGDCPPTDDQREQGQAYNVKRFGPMLLAACHVDGMTEQDAAELIGGEYRLRDEDGDLVMGENGFPVWVKTKATLTQGEASMLYQTAVQLNTNARASLGKG